MTGDLNLGVIDLPYSEPGEENSTTGDVAEILEAHYGVMQMFFDANKGEIEDSLVESFGGSIENILMGIFLPEGPMAQASSEIGAKFKEFIESRGPERMSFGTEKYPIPTMAAREGTNHRFKHPNAKRNASRPSFRDTGLYESSFISWYDGGEKP